MAERGLGVRRSAGPRDRARERAAGEAASLHRIVDLGYGCLFDLERGLFEDRNGKQESNNADH